MVAPLLALILSSHDARVLDSLARRAAGRGCLSGARFEQSVELARGRTVGVYSLLTHPFPENDCIPEYRNAWVAVRIERGIAQFSSLHDGQPQQLGIGPDGAAWLYTLWTVESGAPYLWRSSDGKRWRHVRLPPMRAEGRVSETLERIGVRNGEILIERRGVGHDEVLECWRLAPRTLFIGKGSCGVLQPLRR